MRSLVNIFLKTLLYLTIVVVGLLVGVMLLLQVPAVQTRLVQEVAIRVSKTLQFPVDIKGVSIKWFDSLTLEGVRIQDRQRRDMIQVGRLEVDYNLRNLIDSSAHNIHLDEVVLYRPDVRLIKNPKTGDLNIDEFIARINELLADSTKPSIPNQNVPFTVGHVTLAEGAFSLDDPREPYMRDRKSFDYNHFRLLNLHADVRDLLILGDTIALNMKRLRGYDRDTDIKIRRLDTRFLYCATKMEMADLHAHINNSIVRDGVTFLYDGPSAFGDFNSRVVMQGHLRNSRVQSKDLGYFSSYLRGLKETWQLSGNFLGTVRDFRLSRTDLRFGQGGRSKLAGDIAFKGLPDVDHITVDFNFTPSLVNMADIRQYYPDSSFNKTIGQLGTVAFNATFAGAFDDFVTKGVFRTAIGSVAGDLTLKLADNPALTAYTANLTATRLAVGQLIGRPELIQLVDGQGRIVGKGLSLDRASVDVDSRLSRIGLQGYDYRQVNVRGNLQKAFFHGQLSLNDPNLAFMLDGEFDLRGPQNRFDVRGHIRKADFRALGYLSDSLAVQTALDVELEGNTVDNLVGTANFRNATLSLNGRSLSVDTVSVVSSVSQTQSQQSVRYYDLISDFLTARFQGNFQPQQVVDDLTRLAKEYQLYFAGDAAGLASYYDRKQREFGYVPPVNSPATSIFTQAPDRPVIARPLPRYGIDYVLVARNIAPLVAFLSPTVFVAPNTRLEGQFTVDNTSFFTANVKTDSLEFGSVRFGPSELDLTTSKFTFGKDVLASAVLSSQRQEFTRQTPTKNLQVEASWDVDHIDFTSSLEQVGINTEGQRLPNRADLNGELRFKGDAIDLTFRQSKVRVLDADWTLNPQSLIRKVGDTYTIRNVMVSNQNQYILASGRLAPDSVERLELETRNFLLESLNPLLNTSMSGVLNGVLSVRDVYQTPILESELSVRDLAYNNVLIGDVQGKGEWDQARQRLNVDAGINRSGADVMTLRGTYTPQKKENSFDLKAAMNDVELNLLEPFTQDLFSNIGGTAKGTIAITGTPSYPVLSGEVDVRRGRARFDYLKADLSFEDKVYFGENEIIARRLVLRDPEGNTAQVRGGVYHDGFRYFTLGFDADFRNFKILNTGVKDNELFYGQAVVTGRAELYGPLDNLTIKADLAGNKGTRIYIPLDGATSVADENAIRFVNRSQGGSRPSSVTNTAGTGVAANQPPVDLSRIQMDFNFDITPDAYCEIQLDRQTGDIIKAYGRGRIGMRIDTKGDFTMTGNYEITEGDYTFTFQNIINKRFQIQPNSRITWTGDPYGALLDVTAAYTQYTSLKPLLPVQSASADQSRRYPVDLLIKLNGELGSPAISYDLDVKEYPASSDFRQAVTAFESRIQSNEQEMTRQVSSILLFNQLLPEGASLFEQNQVNTGVANSVSELLSNQISRLASTLDENLDVGVSFGGFTSGTQNENLLNNLQLRFSYRLLNDRLRISRDGGFTYGQSQYNAASLLGEWTLEYWITPDGRFRAKVYNRNQQNILNQYNLSNSITTGGGLSFLYTRSFNRLFGGSNRTTPGLVPNNAATEPATSSGAAVPAVPVLSGSGRSSF
ncbi:translocation/assembly module TamB [Fibrisoma montanum]|uniref:Translocation/assembly module TamB n=1 Tax=Fibrisoma montanum TaxID=2305895 RepID=A0A418MHE5_9BACT|nr:translocation/assembly module TamB domain-containing protein [Fibrisoma montanum]RIV26856.1 translocation/assembly module TamB [Fibrisoma montanum]